MLGKETQEMSFEKLKNKNNLLEVENLNLKTELQNEKINKN